MIVLLSEVSEQVRDVISCRCILMQELHLDLGENEMQETI